MVSQTGLHENVSCRLKQTPLFCKVQIGGCKGKMRKMPCEINPAIDKRYPLRACNPQRFGNTCPRTLILSRVVMKYCTEWNVNRPRNDQQAC